MKKPPEHVVTGCDDCPFEHLGACLLTDGGVYRETAPDAASPDWCPLRKAPILLRLEPIE